MDVIIVGTDIILVALTMLRVGALAVEAGDGGERGLAAAEARRRGRRVRRGPALRPAAVARLYVADHLQQTHVRFKQRTHLAV